VEGCQYETKIRAALVPHYGVTHQMVFRHYNRIMGNRSDATLTMSSRPTAVQQQQQPPRTIIGRPRGSYAASGRGGGVYVAGGRGGMYVGRGGRFNPVVNIPCLVCEEMVSPETMVFHLAHKHFQVA
jgi:hypothetical protein